MSALGNLFFATGGFAIAWFVVFAVIAILLRLYLAFEGFIASKLAEDAGCNWSDAHGDVPALPADLKVSEVSIHNARRIAP